MGCGTTISISGLPASAWGRDKVFGSRATKAAWEDRPLSLHFLSSFESGMPCAGLELEGVQTVPELVHFSCQQEELGGKAGLLLQNPAKKLGPSCPVKSGLVRSVGFFLCR